MKQQILNLLLRKWRRLKWFPVKYIRAGDTIQSGMRVIIVIKFFIKRCAFHLFVGQGTLTENVLSIELSEDEDDFIDDIVYNDHGYRQDD